MARFLVAWLSTTPLNFVTMLLEHCKISSALPDETAKLQWESN